MLIFGYWFASYDKKRALIVLTVSGMETYLKKLLASGYAEKRPFFNMEIGECSCIFGNPSGHMSSFVATYFYFFFIVCQYKMN